MHVHLYKKYLRSDRVTFLSGLPQSTEQESGVKRQFQIMGLEDSTGRLTPKEYKQLCMARVDCHLIHGCEVSPDSEDNHAK
jgi:hypothetical protein